MPIDPNLLTGPELDRRMREIMTNLTPENVLSSCAAMMDLGFGPVQSLDMCEQILKARKAGK